MAIDRKSCFQKQLLDISNEVDDLDERVTTLEDTPTIDAYTKTEADAKFQTISGMSDYATTEEAVLKDDMNNVDGILQVEHLQSEDWEEDDDCKAHVYLFSGLRKSRVTLESEGEETGSSITLQGTTSVGSEGTIEIAGTTNFTTDNRITVTDSNDDVEEIAYLSDIPDAVSGTDDGTNWTSLTIGDDTYNIPSSGGGSTLYRHHIQIFKADSSTYNCECIIYADIINNSNTEITSVDTIKTILSSGVTTGYSAKGVLANGIMKDNTTFRDIIELRASLAVPVVLQGIYKDTSNVYALTTSLSIPTDAEVTDVVFTF